MHPSENGAKTVKPTGFFRSTYGLSELSFDDACTYGYALLAIAGADGEVSPREMEWLQDLFKALGFPEEARELYHTFEYRDANLHDLLKALDARTRQRFSRMLLYDAIRMSRADGHYSDKERAAVSRAAALLGLKSEAVQGLEGLVDLEDAARKLRFSLFA